MRNTPTNCHQPPALGRFRGFVMDPVKIGAEFLTTLGHLLTSDFPGSP